MPDSRRSLAVLVCLLVLSASLPTPASGTVTPEQPTVDNTVTRIQVQSEGDATWAVVVRTRLQTDEEVERYRAFQERFRNNTSRYLDPFSDRIRSVVASAENVTDREMRATNFSARTYIQEVPRRWGVVVYEFRWTDFARTEGSSLVVGDVFQGGYYLAENDTLVMSGPSGYAVDAVAPEPDERGDGTVRWFGPRDFGDQRPRVVFAPAESGVSTANGTTTGGTPSNGLGTAFVVGGILVVLVLGATAVAWRRRADGAPPETETTEPPTGATAPAPTEPEPVRTDAERVEALLAESGGRMKQSAVADALDWSASKTSRVLSDLEDEGIVERTRIGRENVVDLVEE